MDLSEVVFIQSKTIVNSHYFTISKNNQKDKLQKKINYINEND